MVNGSKRSLDAGCVGHLLEAPSKKRGFEKIALSARNYKAKKWRYQGSNPASPLLCFGLLPPSSAVYGQAEASLYCHTEVRALPAGNPHEHDIFSNHLGNLARGVDPLIVGVNKDLGEHFRVVAVASTIGIRIQKNPIIQAMDRLVDHPNQVVVWNVVF